MTPTEPKGGENPHAELFQRLDEILVEESPMHPFGCATWMEATRIAIDMAKDALSGPMDPTPAMIDAGCKVEGWGCTPELDREAAAATYRAMRAAAPTVVGWRGIESAPRDDVLFLGWSSDGFAEVWSGRTYSLSMADGASPAFPRGEAAKLTHWMPLPADPLTDEVG